MTCKKWRHVLVDILIVSSMSVRSCSTPYHSVNEKLSKRRKDKDRRAKRQKIIIILKKLLLLVNVRTVKKIHCKEDVLLSINHRYLDNVIL